MAPYLSHHEIGIVLHIHYPGKGVIVGLYAQVLLPHLLVVVPLLPVAGLDVLVTFNHVKSAGLKSVTGLYVLLVDLLTYVMDTQELAVKIYGRWTERLQCQIESAPAASLLQQSVAEHGVVPVIARCTQRKVIKLFARIVMEQLV